jgi:hypothetical protein
MVTVAKPAGNAIQPAPSSSITTEPAPLPPPVTQPGNPARANRLVAAGVLAVMAVMAAVGLTYALLTVDVRRAHDKSLPRQSRKFFERFRKSNPEPSESTIAPNRLESLGYLPAGTNVVAGVHVEELRRSPSGKEWLARGFKIGNFELNLDAIKKRLGLSADEIDHVVLGAQLQAAEDADFPPPTYLIIRTRQPYDAEKVKTALGAKRPREVRVQPGDKRLLYPVKVQPLPLELWLAGENTLILGLSKMEQLPARPSEEAQLSAEVREVLEQRIGPGAPLWLAGHSSNWEKTLLPTLLGVWKDVPVVSRLAQVRTFAVWLQPDKEPKLLGAFRCADESNARQIEKEELASRGQKNPEAFKFSRDGEWLSIQMKLGSGARPDAGGK